MTWVGVVILAMIGATLILSKHLIDTGCPIAGLAVAFTCGLVFALPVRVCFKMEIRDWHDESPSMPKAGPGEREA